MRWVASLFLVGCGSVVGADYQGDVLYEVRGAIVTDGQSAPPAANYSVALRWLQHTGASPLTQSVDVTPELPSRYSLRVYEPPPDDAMFALGGLFDTRVALAQPVLFEDRNEDGLWSQGEPLVGFAEDNRVLWVPPQTSAQLLVPPGFQLVRLSDNVCDTSDVGAFVEPVQTNETVIHTGSAAQTRLDLDCDDQADDWGTPFGWPEHCPPFDTIAAECEVYAHNGEPAVLPTGDPFQVCFDVACPGWTCEEVLADDATCEELRTFEAFIDSLAPVERMLFECYLGQCHDDSTEPPPSNTGE